MTQREFFERMETACALAKSQGAVINTDAVIAQAANESGWGNSLLTQRANNLFGIKAFRDWQGQTVTMRTREWARDRGYYEVDARWRAYPDWAGCVVDYAALIARLSWFRDALPHADKPAGDGDPIRWIRALLPEPGQPGWATSPAYLAHVSALLPVYYRLMQRHAPAPQDARVRVVTAAGAVDLPADAVRMDAGLIWVRVRQMAEAMGWKATWDAQQRLVTVEAT